VSDCYFNTLLNFLDDIRHTLVSFIHCELLSVFQTLVTYYDIFLNNSPAG